jgi:hypothetical protein
MFQLARTASLATSLLMVATVSASGQRGSRGSMGLPRIVPAPTATTVPAPTAGRGIAGGPRYPAAGVRRSGDLPRLVGAPPRGARGGYATGFGGGAGYRSPHNSGTIVGHGSRYPSRPYSRWGVGAGCVATCLHAGARFGKFYGSYLLGYPFGVAIPVGYYYGQTVFAEPVVEQYAEAGGYAPQPEPARVASKLIVVGGGTGGGGDALTIEAVGDSVRLNWLGAGRATREVMLFVADSAQRKLATRSASPTAPAATFEVATLSAPVAYAGVTVTFADGVTTTTLVPYQGGTAGQRR